MNKAITVIQASRQALLNLIEDLSIDQLNEIPAGFNNNIAWQLGHLIVSQQILCYKLSQLPLLIDKDWVEKYRNGSRPESFINTEEVSSLKQASAQNIEVLERDLTQNIFANFQPYTISTYKNLTLANIDDALEFIVSHEGLHYGCCLMMKKFV